MKFEIALSPLLARWMQFVIFFAAIASGAIFGWTSLNLEDFFFENTLFALQLGFSLGLLYSLFLLRVASTQPQKLRIQTFSQLLRIFFTPLLFHFMYSTLVGIGFFYFQAFLAGTL